jgi:hypothetical protein
LRATMGLPRLPHVVLDMHLMRRPTEVDPLVESFRASGQKVLLPWRQLYEMSKSDQATSTFIASVNLFLREPISLAIARPSFILAQVERKFRLKLTSLVDEIDTLNIRHASENLRESSPGTEEGIARFLREVRERAERILRMENDPSVIKQLTGWWKSEAIGRPRAAAIKRGLSEGDRTLFREALVEFLSLENLRAILKGVGYGHRAAERICLWPSISALKVIGLLTLALHWRVMHGVETQSESQLVNDVSDAEFCIIALYGRGYRTEEKKWIALYDDCRHVCEALWGA